MASIVYLGPYLSWRYFYVVATYALKEPASGGYSGVIISTVGHAWLNDATLGRVAPPVDSIRLRLGSDRNHWPLAGDLEIDRPSREQRDESRAELADKILRWMEPKCAANFDREKLRWEADFLAGIAEGPMPPASQYPDGPFDREFRGMVWGGGASFETLATRNRSWLLLLPVGLICFALMFVIVRRVCHRVSGPRIRAPFQQTDDATRP